MGSHRDIRELIRCFLIEHERCAELECLIAPLNRRLELRTGYKSFVGDAGCRAGHSGVLGVISRVQNPPGPEAVFFMTGLVVVGTRVASGHPHRSERAVLGKRHTEHLYSVKA